LPNLHGENIFTMLKCSHTGSANINLNILWILKLN
jgi:hypothetical protein